MRYTEYIIILRSLMHYVWPGNVRGLRSTIEKAMILSEGEVLNRVHKN